MSDAPPALPPPPFWRTVYYETVASRKPDRAMIRPEHVALTVTTPQHSRPQPDGRIRLWRFEPAFGKWLRVVVLSDGRTVHNALPDRSFRP